MLDHAPVMPWLFMRPTLYSAFNDGSRAAPMVMPSIITLNLRTIGFFSKPSGSWGNSLASTGVWLMLEVLSDGCGVGVSSLFGGWLKHRSSLSESIKAHFGIHNLIKFWDIFSETWGRRTRWRAAGSGRRSVWRAGESCAPSCCAEWLDAGECWSWWTPLWTQRRCWSSDLAGRCTEPGIWRCYIWQPFWSKG